MVTLTQAQERAERWINADVPGHRRREVHVREFDLGFVAWAETPAEPPVPGGASGRLVIARDGGDATLWPALPVDEVIRQYQETYRPAPETAGAAATQPQHTDLEATSFLLTPPEWLQQAADRMGIPGSRTPDGGPSTPGGDTRADDTGTDASAPGSPWDDAGTGGPADRPGREPPATVLAPPLSGSDADDTPPPTAGGDETPTALLAERGTLPPTAVSGTVDSPGTPETDTRRPDGPATPGAPPPPPHPPTAPPAAQAATPHRGDGPSVPPPPGPPPAPGTDGSDDAGGDGYVPTQLVSADDIARHGGPGTDPQQAEQQPQNTPPDGHAPPSRGGETDGTHHAATMPASPAPDRHGTPPPPGGPGAPPPDPGMHGAATMLAGPAPGSPGTPPPPGPPGPPGPAPQSAGAPPAHGHPQQPTGAAPVPPPGTPTVGPGYMAVLRHRAPDGSEQQLIRRSAPGTPHPEWQILHELRALNVPPHHVLELHTELESCDLPGGYCARMIRENWPQVRVSHTAAYGTDHATRQQGMRHLVEHQGELHQVADAPPRPAPHRVPLPPQHQIQPAPPIPPDAIGHELAQAFGPQGVFRFDQRAVSRQGVPDIVGQVLVWAGVPLDVNPFFWGQAQPGRPVPTLAELAGERGVQPAPDAGSYLVMGNDFGRQICVQYGTAHIVAVPLETAADGQPTTPQFVNTGLPEFVRCLALLGRMWRLRYGLTPEQAGRWTVDFQLQLAMLDPAALATPENWWSVLLEQMWDGLL